jgi:hypothetical protein
MTEDLINKTWINTIQLPYVPIIRPRDYYSLYVDMVKYHLSPEAKEIIEDRIIREFLQN